MIFASLSKCFSSCLATWWAAHINQWLVQCEQLCGVILWWYDVMHRHCIGSCCLVGMTVVSFLFMHPEFCSLPQPHVCAPMIWQPSQGQEVCCLEQELLDAEGVTEYIYIFFFFFQQSRTMPAVKWCSEPFDFKLLVQAAEEFNYVFFFF